VCSPRSGPPWAGPVACRASQASASSSVRSGRAHRSARRREQVVDVVGADGVEREQVRKGTRTVETPHGEVTVTRNLYQAPGADGLAPLDAALELPDEHYSLEVRRLVAEESARASFDEVAELVDKHAGAHVPRRQLEQLTVRAAQDFDAFGVIEGACRYLVKDRMGRTGARWSLTGAETILRLRALKTSGDFDDYWQFHLAQEHDRVHRSRYAEGEVPNSLPRERPRLRLVE
jgi:hypothetical protein